MANSFKAAIAAVRDHAFEQFNAASAQITRLGNSPPPPASTPEQKRQHAADLLKAQNEMAAALQQLGQAEEMLSEDRGREGYDAVVTLMVRTQKAAADVYDILPPLTADPNAAGQIVVLTNLLLALARLSPASIWQKDSTPAGSPHE